MKTYFIYTFIFFNITNIFCQNLTFEELISLRKKEIANVEEYLTRKNWSFLSANTPSEDNMGSAIFAYEKRDHDDKAKSFIRYHFSKINNRKILDIQVNNKDIYNLYLAKLKSLGCEIINSKLVDGKIIKIYKGSTIITEVIIASRKENLENTETFYTFSIYEKNDYIKNFMNNPDERLQP